MTNLIIIRVLIMDSDWSLTEIPLQTCNRVEFIFLKINKNPK